MHLYNYLSPIAGIVIDQYSSLAEVVKIMRKYTKDSMMEIRDHMNKNEFVMSCDYIDQDEVKRFIKCINELKKSKTSVIKKGGRMLLEKYNDKLLTKVFPDIISIKFSRKRCNDTEWRV